MSTYQHYCREAGSAATNLVMKMFNNTVMAGMAESVSLADAIGVDTTVLMDVLEHSPLCSAAVIHKDKAMAQGLYHKHRPEVEPGTKGHEISCQSIWNCGLSTTRGQLCEWIIQESKSKRIRRTWYSYNLQSIRCLETPPFYLDSSPFIVDHYIFIPAYIWIVIK